jgi:single-stranded-DNA-specific exonuclease
LAYSLIYKDMSKRWVVADQVPEKAKEEFPDMNPVLLSLLHNRGIKTKEEAEVFLNPNWDRDVHDPSLFNNMVEGVKLVFETFEKKGVITVHGDYDADGVCGAAVLITTLRDVARAFGYDEKLITHYIPHREKEGYGLSVETVDKLNQDHKTKLIITVDCGISNKDAIDHAKTFGIDTIVCDHHAMPKELPESAVLIHPLVPGEKFPNKFLCGTGVAFKFACGLIKEAQARGADLKEGHEKWLLDLVAIATVTDMMKIQDENRLLENFGLLVLNKTKRPGLRKLIDISGGKLGELDTVSIGFKIGPRLNAAGRMYHASKALDLLIEEDETQASVKALELHDINKERQKVSQAMFVEAKQMVGDMTGRSSIIVMKEGWSAGLVGLAAGKLANEFNVPVFVFGKDGEKHVGSGRGVTGFDLTTALHASSEYLDKYGGHPQACGLSIIGSDNFEKAKSKMEEFIAEGLKNADLTPELLLDAEIFIDDIDWELYNQLEKIKPFGMGNKEPIFSSTDVKVVGVNLLGSTQKHLRLTIQSSRGKIMKMIGFGFGPWANKLSLGQQIDVAYEISMNEWKGNRELQLKIVDIKER